VSRQISLPAGMRGLPVRPAPGATPAAPQGTPLTARDLLGIVQRRIWLILVVTIMSTIVAGGLWYIFLLYAPRYTSEGFIACKMPIQPDLLKGFSPMPRKDIIMLETQNHAVYLRADSFLSSVLTRTKVRQTTWYKKRENDRQELMEDMKSSFSASPRRDTEYVVASMTCENPKEAKVILDEALLQFEQEMLESATGDLQQRLSALNEQKRQLLLEIQRKHDQLLRMAKQVNVPGWETGKTVLNDELTAINADRIYLEGMLEDAWIQQSRLEEARQRRELSGKVQMMVDNDGMVASFKSQMATLTIQLNNLLKRVGEDHQEVKSIRSSIQNFREQLTSRERQLQMQYSAMEQRNLDRQIQALQQQLEKTNERIREVSAKHIDLDRKLVRYKTVEEEIEYLNKRLEQFEHQINATKVSMDNPARIRVQVHTGTEPLEKSFPRLTMFLAGGFFLGLLLSAGMAFLLEFMDDSIKTPSDVMRHLNIPLLGMIPKYEEDDAEAICIAKVTSIHPDAIISESYRQVRTNLFFSAPVAELKIILITSSSAGCGKTTTAVNLGITFASEGRRVLLVDANFRRASLNHLFPAEGPSRGLSNILVGQTSAADVIRQSGIEGLDLIESGPVPPNPAVLLSSKRMKDFLENQRQYYDHIIIDGPPTLVLTDAQILAGQVDGTILTVHAGETARGVLQRSLRELKRNKVRLLGALLNAVKPRKGGYFEESYRLYYDYIGTEPLAALPDGQEEKKV